MESVYANEFNFDIEHEIWSNIFKQKVVNICIPKLSEFIFKIVHNILPCGNCLNKWKPEIGANCTFCNCTETIQHMLYDCS